MRERKKLSLQTILYGVTAVLLFGLLMLLTFPDRQAQLTRTHYPVVIMGDSIMGQSRGETSVAEQLEGMLEVPVYNGAFGGTCLAMQEDVKDNYTTDLMNMVGLSKAIAADDFGVQQTARSRRDITDYYAAVVDELECVDFGQVEVLVLAFGINDYHAGVPLDNADNPMDEYTYGGALRSVVTTIKQRYPDMRIVLATPTYAWYRSNGLTCEEYMTGDAFLEDYVEKEIAIARELGVEVIDLYHDVYPHAVWEDWEIYTEDGLHPNERGRALLATLLAEKLLDEG